VNREPLDIDAVRAAYDGQIRRRAEPDKPGAVIEADADVMRWVAPGAQTSRITWSIAGRRWWLITAIGQRPRPHKSRTGRYGRSPLT
jgi:hypothetical protein